jgi:hypothetical protein
MKKGDIVLFPVSKGSIQLTIGTVIFCDNEDRIQVQFFSTPAKTWTSVWVVVDKQTPILCPDPEAAKDCIGNLISPGDTVYYLEKNTIYQGIVDSIESRLWVIIEGKRIRNVSVYVKR